MSGRLLCILIFCVYLNGSHADGRTLYVGALFELSNHWYAKYINFFITILEHAFDEIDNRTDILADYSLKLITKDTQGKTGLAARQMFSLMTEGPPVVAVIGPSLSSEMTMIGQIGPVYDVLQLSYIATTSSTVDREIFSTLFRINQVMDDLNPLRIKMMQYFNWNRVGTIYYQDDTSTSFIRSLIKIVRLASEIYFVESVDFDGQMSDHGHINTSSEPLAQQMDLFHDLLKQHNMTLVTSAVVSDNSDIKVLISRMLQYDVRIIIGSFNWKAAPRLFCEAYRQGLYGSDHIWILSGPILYRNWMNRIDIDTLDCTFEEFLKATDGHFTLNFDKIDAQNQITIANKTSAEVTAVLKAMVEQTSYSLSENYGWVYDTAWALALGLNNSLRHLNESGLDNYTNNPYYLDAILKGMYGVDFAGISGPVSFDYTGGRVGVTYIEQNFNNTRFHVAMYNHLTDNLTWFVPINTLWPGGEVPQDRFTYHRVMVAPNIPSLVLVMIANTVCCMVAVGFLGFNIHYRRNSNIKLSSPTINNVMIAGSIMMYFCVFLTSFDYGNLLSKAVDKNICMVQVWIMCLGFTLLFGALFSKTWRVHILFRDYKLKKTTIKDYHLFGVILFLAMVDCIVLVAWSMTHSLRKESVVTKRKDQLNLSNVIAEVYTYCYHPYEGYWFVTLYIYKGLLLAFGTFLAWETRHVNVPALNDSKYIGFCIYNVVIVCIFGVPLMHVLPTEQTTLNFVLLSSLVMFCTTMCLCILFIPKIKIRNKISERFLNPSLNTLATKSKSSTNEYSQRSTEVRRRVNDTEVSGISDGKNSVSQVACPGHEELKQEIKSLRGKLAAETTAIGRLKKDILLLTGNVHFHKVGTDYIVFQSKKDGEQSEKQASKCELESFTDNEATA